MPNSENDLPPERRRLNRARRTGRILGGKPILPRRKIEDIPPYERLPGRLPKGIMPRPKDPEEAREWLKELADFLSTYPNGSGRFRFIAYALKEFYRGKKRLSEALCLTVKRNIKAGRPTTPSETVTRIVTMLRNHIPVPSIMKTTKVSKDTVETIRAEMGKATYAVPDYERDEDGDARPTEWNLAKERAETVRPERRKAILEGFELIKLSDLIDESDHPEIPTKQATCKRNSSPVLRRSR